MAWHDRHPQEDDFDDDTVVTPSPFDNVSLGRQNTFYGVTPLPQPLPEEPSGEQGMGQLVFSDPGAEPLTPEEFRVIRYAPEVIPATSEHLAWRAPQGAAAPSYPEHAVACYQPTPWDDGNDAFIDGQAPAQSGWLPQHQRLEQEGYVQDVYGAWHLDERQALARSECLSGAQYDWVGGQVVDGHWVPQSDPRFDLQAAAEPEAPLYIAAPPQAARHIVAEPQAPHHVAAETRVARPYAGRAVVQMPVVSAGAVSAQAQPPAAPGAQSNFAPPGGEPGPRLGRGLLGAVVGAALGAALWGGIGFVTGGWEFKYGAIVIGLLTGGGAALLAGGRTKTLGIAAAVLGFAGIAAGKVLFELLVQPGLTLAEHIAYHTTPIDLVFYAATVGTAYAVAATQSGGLLLRRARAHLPLLQRV